MEDKEVAQLIITGIVGLVKQWIEATLEKVLMHTLYATRSLAVLHNGGAEPLGHLAVGHGDEGVHLLL